MRSLFVGRLDGQTLVRISGEVDLASVRRLEDALDLIDGPLVVDCSRLEFIDVAGLRALAEAAVAHRSVTLRHASPSLVRLVTTLGFDTDLEIEAAVDAPSEATAYR
jgi:anti-anti-sigma factor